MSATTPPLESQLRAEVISPVSPKPVHYPSPSNIPILEKQMDPAFHETLPQAFAPSHTEVPAPSEQRPEPLTHQVSAGAEDHTNNAVVMPALNQNGIGEQSYTRDQDQTSNQETSSQAKPDAPHLPADTLGDVQAANIIAELPMNNVPDGSLPSQGAPILAQPSRQVSKLDGISTETPTLGGGAVDFETLLANLSKSPTHALADNLTAQNVGTAAVPAQAAAGSSSPAHGLGGNPNLPPRPPPQETSSIHPNFAQSNDLRAYHPHSQVNQPGPYAAPGALPSVMTGGNTLPNQPNPPFPLQPNSATYATNSPVTPSYSQRQSLEPHGNDGERWDMEAQRHYDQFVQDERMNEQDRNWTKFPDGSRLFVGLYSPFR
jgi:hypothetical protein